MVPQSVPDKVLRADWAFVIGAPGLIDVVVRGIVLGPASCWTRARLPHERHDLAADLRRAGLSRRTVGHVALRVVAVAESAEVRPEHKKHTTHARAHACACTRQNTEPRIGFRKLKA